MFQLFKQALVGVGIHVAPLNRNFVNLAERTFSSVVVAIVELARAKGPCSKVNLIGAESNIDG